MNTPRRDKVRSFHSSEQMSLVHKFAPKRWTPQGQQGLDATFRSGGDSGICNSLFQAKGLDGELFVPVKRAGWGFMDGALPWETKDLNRTRDS